MLIGQCHGWIARWLVLFALGLFAAVIPNASIDAQSLSCNDCACLDNGECPCFDHHLWVRTDYLLWWARGSDVPALVTTSPTGTPLADAGVLGVPETEVLFGGSLNDVARSGIRVRGGMWIDCGQTCGIDFHFLALDRQSDFSRHQSDGDPILSRPFTDATTGDPIAELAAFPGVVGGTVSGAARSQGLYGWGVNIRHLLCACQSCCNGCERLDTVIGYRNANLSDQVRIREQLTSPLFSAGTELNLSDDFSTRNTFHGVNLGIRYEKQKSLIRVNAFANVALGVTDSRIAIDGWTHVVSPGLPTFVNQGGLLALSSNIGRTTESKFSALFDVGFDVGLQIHRQFEIHAGYTFLLWPGVYRAGDQIDTVVNPNLLPPPLVGAGGPARPARRNHSSSFWAQGISFGFQYRY